MMEELPAKIAGDGASSKRLPSPPPPLPKIQVKSQNPISKQPAVGKPSLPSPSPLRDGTSPNHPKPSPIHSPNSLRGGGGLVSPYSRAQIPKSPRSPRSIKSPVRSPKTPSYVPPGMIMPVLPASREDLAGAQTSMATGLTYPWNEWGPITKYGYLYNVAPTWVQRRHFRGNHDKLTKKRLTARRFCFVRHPAYKELIKPEDTTCAAYMDPQRKEFWRTDVDTILKREMKAEKERYQRLLDYIGGEEGFRKSELQRDREDRWKAYSDYDKNVKWYPGFRNNQSGVKYDIFTHAPTDEYEEKRVNAEKMKEMYNLAQRGLYIQARMSGARPYNIISWHKVPPCRGLPEWPEDIGPLLDPASSKA